MHLTQETVNEESQTYQLLHQPTQNDNPYPTTTLNPYSEIVNTSHTYQSTQSDTSKSQSFTPQSCNDPLTSSPAGEIVIKKVTAKNV